MPSAMDQVLHTVELVDLILSHLSMRDLLAAQRVNFLLYDLIKSSRSMQKRKYLLPDTTTKIAKGGYAATNPLYLQRFVQQACLYAMQQLNPDVTFMGMDRFVISRTKSFVEPQASWRRMLLFQPPVPQAMLRPLSASFEDTYDLIQNKDGAVTMGDVVDYFGRRAEEGGKAIDLLSGTVRRKVIWMVTPIAGNDI